VEGTVDFITLDDLHDDVAGCFHDNPVGPALCRSVMKTVVSILELCGFQRSLQAQGKRRLTRCLTFDPIPDSLRRLDAGREVIAGELMRATQSQNSGRVSSSGGGHPAVACAQKRYQIAVMSKTVALMIRRRLRTLRLLMGNLKPLLKLTAICLATSSLPATHPGQNTLLKMPSNRDRQKRRRRKHRHRLSQD
jgi:hypothetical protein